MQMHYECMPDQNIWCGGHATTVGVTGWDKFYMIHNDIFWLIIGLAIISAAYVLISRIIARLNEESLRSHELSLVGHREDGYRDETERIRVRLKYDQPEDGSVHIATSKPNE